MSNYVKDFHLFHGAVLATVLRSEKPVALRLVETRPGQNWSTYTLNDSIDLFITHSRTPRDVERSGGGTSWTFGLSENQIRQLRPRPGGSGRPVWAALVCGRKDLGTGEMYVCLLDPEQVASVISEDVGSQSLTVRKPTRGMLRVFKDHQERFKVSASRLETWEVPGA